MAVGALGLPAGVGKTTSALAVNDTQVDVSSIMTGSEDLIESFFRMGTILQFEDDGNPGNPHATEYTVTAIDRDNAKLTLARYDTATRSYVNTNVILEAHASGSKIYRTIVAGDCIHALPR